MIFKTDVNWSSVLEKKKRHREKKYVILTVRCFTRVTFGEFLEFRMLLASELREPPLHELK